MGDLPRWLTEKQREAVEFKEGNLQIIACSGSGKTDTITLRIAMLIKEGVKPENILAFTFTEKAAETMKLRIRKHIEHLLEKPGELGNMYVGTIHSFCFELLKKYDPKYQGYDVLDDAARVIFVEDNYSKIGLKTKHFGWWNRQEDRPSNHWEKILNFLRNVDVVREEMLGFDDMTDGLFKDAFEEYEKLLDTKRYLDFSSMMDRAVSMLKNNEEILKQARNQWKFVIVDEYQDINPVQEELIRLIAGSNGSLCVVGDDDQAIYQWRGAKVENILTFKKRYPNVKQIPLEINFRSTEGIIAHANELITHNKGNRLEKKMKHEGPESIRKYEIGDIYKVNFDTQEEEIRFITEKIKEVRGVLIQEKDQSGNITERPIDWRDIAILFRSVKGYAKPYLDALKKAGVRIIVKGSTGLFEHPEVKVVLEGMKLVLSQPNELENKKDEFALHFNTLFCDGKTPRTFSEFIAGLKERCSQYKKRNWVNLQELYQRVLNLLGLDKSEPREEIMYNLGQLSKVISDYEGVHYPLRNDDISISRFFDFVERYAAEAYEAGGMEERFGGVNAVQVMTIHQAKGLEFPVVFMPSLTGRGFRRSMMWNTTKWFIDDELINKDEYLNDELSQRRLFYVALTRAKKFLSMTSYRTESQFLDEISTNFVTTDQRPDPTKRRKSTDFEPPSDFKFPTNFSELSDYFNCPRDYKLRYVYGFNPVLKPLIGYGRSIHHLLNVIHKESQRGRKVNLQEVQSLTERLFYLRFAPPDLLSDNKKRAFRVLKTYLENYATDLSLSLETEKPFEFIFEDSLISGTIDLIRREIKGVEEIIIVDFKTEKDRDSTMYARDKEQVILYSIAHERSFGILPKIACVHYLDEEGGERKEVGINNEEKDSIAKKVSATIHKIKKMEFPCTPEKELCESCDFKLLCVKR